MAVSLQRVAAFEFLIQFRSAGRNQLRRSRRDLGRLVRDVNLSRSAIAANTRVTRDYTRALFLQSKGARDALNSEHLLNRALNSGARARQRSITAARAQRAQLFNSNLGRAFASRGTQAVRRGVSGIFGDRAGNRAAGTFARNLAKIRTGFSRMAGPIGVVSNLIKGFVGLLGVAVGAIARWARFNALAVAGLGLLAVGIGSIADAFVKLNNRLRVAASETESVSETSQELLNISLRSRTAYTNIAELFGRISINAKNLGISQREILSVTELTAKAFKIAGGTAREESQTIIQFAQALGSNRLSGDELRAVREQAPELSQSIARGLTAIGKFGTVTIGTLKELAEQGKLTTRVVIDAINQQQTVIEKRFGRVQATFSDGVTQIRSSLFFFAGSVLETLSLGPKFFRFADGIARAFQKLSSRTGQLSLALRNLPAFFRALNLSGLSRVFDFLSGIGDFFANLPQRILAAAQAVNSFVSLTNNGVSADSAARAAFGASGNELRQRFLPFSNAVGAFVGQLRFFGSVLARLTDAINGLVSVISRIPGLGGVVADPVTAVNNDGVLEERSLFREYGQSLRRR